ncbi:hypothetical protein LP415_18860 [Polaromonas sp. P1(28)-8]|nr:hypothetical protein LP415_18860 [Polaromonas sp. P1(28)-8]
MLSHPIHQYRAVPWFWSDQGEARTQVAGDVSGSEEIQRGDFAAGKGVSVHLSNGTIVGVAALNNAKDFNLFKRLIAAKAKLPLEQLADPHLDLKRAVQEAEKSNQISETSK